LDKSGNLAVSEVKKVKKISAPIRNSTSSPTVYFTPINLPDCYTKIAELAFYKAESRGFEPGHELDDWVEAEREYKKTVTENNPH
jgi:hypothetical protein